MSKTETLSANPKPCRGYFCKNEIFFDLDLARSPERLFSTAGNVMTKKRSLLTCDNIEELVRVYLHEVWLQVREWEAVKKMRLA